MRRTTAGVLAGFVKHWMTGTETLRCVDMVELIGEGDMRRGEIWKKSDGVEFTSDSERAAPMILLSREMTPTQASFHNMVRNFCTL